MDVGWLSPWTSRPSSASGGDHRRRRAPRVAAPLGHGGGAVFGRRGGGPAGGRHHSPAPGFLLGPQPPVSEPSDGPGWRTRLPGPLPAGAPARVKAFDLLPALLRLVADEERAGDSSGFLQKLHHRLEDMLHHPSFYHFSAADRLVRWVARDTSVTDPTLRSTIVTSVLTTIWDADRAARRTRLATVVTELVKANKRVLLVAPDNRTLTEALLAAAKGLRGAGLQYRSFLCCYDPPSITSAGGLNLRDLTFDAQVSAFLGKSQSDKAGLRRKLERYLELTPTLRYKAEKQKDLDEVRHLEWRLLTALGDTQAEIKRLQSLMAVYESLPLWQRLGMQVVGSNVATMKENCVLYEAQKQEYLKELEIAQTRINELKPEAYVDPELRPEYEELKDEIERLGGVAKVQDVLTMEEDTKRLPFLQAKRVLAVTPVRVIGDAIFHSIRYDALLVDEGPRIPLPLLVACACLARERIVLAGDPHGLPPSSPTPYAVSLRRPTSLTSPPAAPAQPAPA